MLRKLLMAIFLTLTITSCRADEPSREEIYSYVTKALPSYLALSSLDYKVLPNADGHSGRISVKGDAKSNQALYYEDDYRRLKKDFVKSGGSEGEFYRLRDKYAKPYGMRTL